MHNFILQIFLMFSLGTMIYLIARAAPRIGDTMEATKPKSLGKLDNIIASLPIEKIDLIVSNFIEKQLRRLKVVIMKWDNTISDHLNKYRKTNGEKEKTGLFDEISQENVQASTAQKGELNGESGKSDF